MNIEYAWAAGLFEGEGCLSWLRRERAPYPTAALRMADEDVVRRFAAIVEVGKVTLPKRRPNRKQLWAWRGFGLLAMERLEETIGPFLGQRRRAKLDEMLTFKPVRDPKTRQWLDPRSFHTENGREKVLAVLRANGERMRCLSDEQEREVRELYAAGGWSHRSLAEHFGVAKSTIGKLCCERSLNAAA